METANHRPLARSAGTTRQLVVEVAKVFGVAQSFVQRCFEQETSKQLEEQGYLWEKAQALSTPACLGIDEFVRRKGHQYETILADIQSKLVVAIGSWRKLEEAQKLLERLTDPDAVQLHPQDWRASPPLILTIIT